MSADGTIVVGASTTENGKQNAVLWKIVYPASEETN
ncbi:hypothetical protein O4443_06630 [Xylella fastidiosa subsp. pauca]|nr:hypothetical protein [Xylella fastidiosa]MDG5824071.1 hypothetical protein [Xylella fastidiosa subsp. pauca]MDG5824652.1 hypothetical protein [Xylella fastidiosa subsp. pauca]WGZ37825.1 hypothetical protein O4443_06630 [Xylella fastidiosa subsp. pauca]